MSEEKTTYDTATLERLKKAGDYIEVVVTESGRHTIRMLDGTRFETMWKRNQIDGKQYAAADLFYSDWYLAGLSGSGAIDPAKEVVDCSRRFEPNERQLSAAHRFNSANAALGPGANIVISIVCAGTPIEAYGRTKLDEKGRTKAIEKAMDALRKSLDILVDHYGLRTRRIGVKSVYYGPSPDEEKQ